MQKQKSPTMSKWQGTGKNITDTKESISSSAAVQCLCSPCVYFRAVSLPSGYVRKLCTFTGERLTLSGNPLCEARQDKAGASC